MGRKSLPAKFHGVMTLALEDEARANRSNYYNLNMGAWHVPTYGKDAEYNYETDEWSEPPTGCEVCFAGCVMALSLDADRTKEIDPDYYNDGNPTERKLYALDLIRQGAVLEALKEHVYPHGFYDSGDREFVRSDALTDRIDAAHNLIASKLGERVRLYGKPRVEVFDYRSHTRREWRKQMFVIRDALKKYNL